MNRKQWTALCAMILTVAVLITSLCSCSTTIVQAKDLMDGIEKNEGKGKTADQAFLSSQFDFAVELLQNAHKDEENTLLSPLSLALALSMTANGANKESLAQMEAVLGNGIPIREMNAYLLGLTSSLSREKGAKAEIANSIWFHQNLDVKKDFLQTNADYYNAAAYRSEFNDATLDEINSWVKKNTDGMIEKIIERISPQDRMFLVNAIVFDGKWESKYQKNDLFDGIFYNADGTKQKVTMMHSDENLYLSDEKVTGFMKPYEGGKYSFAAFLPNQGIDLEEYLAEFTGQKLSDLISGAKKSSVNVTLPKFKQEYKNNLSEILSQMGMEDIFTEKADLSGISDHSDLVVSEVLHKTYLSLDENGTRAAAVSSVGLKEMAMVQEYSVTLDRPFLYMILDNNTNLPIFLGITNNL